jgi:hypothetical protein
MIDLQRARVARAAKAELAEGGLNKYLSIEIKRLNTLICTYGELAGSPQAKTPPSTTPGPSIMEKLLADVFDKSRRKPRARVGKGNGSLGYPPEAN